MEARPKHSRVARRLAETALVRIVHHFFGERDSLHVTPGSKANFADPEAQGPRAYADQMAIDHPEIEIQTAQADAVLAVGVFHEHLFAT